MEIAMNAFSKYLFVIFAIKANNNLILNLSLSTLILQV